MVKTKIISTIGPSSENTTALRNMMLNGMDVARLNLSHGNHSQHQQRIDLIRGLNKKYRRRIKILLDLQGHRLRIDKLNSEKPIKLKKGQHLRLASKKSDAGNALILINHKVSFKSMKKGDLIYIDDGNICLGVEKRSKSILDLKVVIPGLLKPHKGINIPGTDFNFKGLTRKDKRDILFGLKNKVDYIAQSFVRNKDDIIQLKNFVNKSSDCRCRILAKIESRSGIRNIDQILKYSDGIMIARGDMGVSIPIHEIPIMQKIIIKKCKENSKIAITATQMLESMTEQLRPTRAEVTDVANAILDGSDFLMLSAETAVGRYPAQVVRMMNQIIKFTEASLKNKKIKIR